MKGTFLKESILEIRNQSIVQCTFEKKSTSGFRRSSKQASEARRLVACKHKAIGEFSSIIQQCVLCNTRGLLAKSQKRDGERKEPCFASNFAMREMASKAKAGLLFPPQKMTKIPGHPFMHNFPPD